MRCATARGAHQSAGPDAYFVMNINLRACHRVLFHLFPSWNDLEKRDRYRVVIHPSPSEEYARSSSLCVHFCDFSFLFFFSFLHAIRTCVPEGEKKAREMFAHDRATITSLDMQRTALYAHLYIHIIRIMNLNWIFRLFNNKIQARAISSASEFQIYHRYYYHCKRAPNLILLPAGCFIIYLCDSGRSSEVPWTSQESMRQKNKWGCGRQPYLPAAVRWLCCASLDRDWDLRLRRPATDHRWGNGAARRPPVCLRNWWTAKVSTKNSIFSLSLSLSHTIALCNF